MFLPIIPWPELMVPSAYVHKHEDSLRHNVGLAKSIGLDVVDEIFDPSRIPSEIQQLKGRFTVQRLLSLSRTCLLAGDRRAGRSFFTQALKRDWRVVFSGSYCRKFLRSFW